MPPDRPTLDVLETVTRRRELLSALADQPCPKRDLVDRLDCSRSTIDRAIRELEWLSLVGREDGQYRLTVAGRLALVEHRRSANVFDSIDEASALLDEIPRDAPISTALLDSADISVPPSHAPNEPLQAFATHLDRADRIRTSATAERLPQLRERLYDRTVDGDLDAEMLLTDDLATFVRSEYPQLLYEIAVDGDVDFYVTDSLPYELAIVEYADESRVFLFVLDGTKIKAVIQNDSTAAFEWAEDVYQTFCETATALSPPE